MEQVIFDLEKQVAESIYGGGEQILYVTDGEGNITVMIVLI